MKLALPRRRVIAAALSLVLLCAAGAGAWIWWHGRNAAPRYITQAVTRGDIERSITMTGTVDPVTTVQIGSYVSGIVKSLGCDFNTEVKVGQVCARIDPNPFRLVVEQNKADLATSEAQLKKDQAALVYAKISLERDAKLLAGGVVSADQVDSDRNTEAQAEAQIALDQATLTEKRAVLQGAEVNLGYTDIVSPVEGTVITRNVDIGQTVVSSLQSSTLFVIAKDLTKMQVDTNVAEADIAAVKVGQTASFTVQAFPDKEFKGTVRQIRQAPITVQSVVTYDVVVAVDNPAKLLLPGMTADTHIITAEARDVLRVPLAAIRFLPADFARRRANRHQGEGHERRGPPGSRVWVLRDDQLTAVPVKVGMDDGTLVEISSDALKPGDRVVVSEAHEGEQAPTQQRRTGNFGQQQRRAPVPGGGRF
jgi:HlyD family secretion protein